MMDLRKSTGAMRLAMKAAVRRAIDLAGGGRSVEQATRVDHTMLSRYANPNVPEQHCPIDVAMDLDLEAGSDVILTAWADARGYDLVRREPVAASNAPWCMKIADMVAQDGRTVGALLQAVADGHISPADARCILPEIERDMEILRQAKDRVIAEAGVRS